MNVIPIRAVSASLLANVAPGQSPTDVAPVVDWQLGAGTYEVQTFDFLKQTWNVYDTVQIKQGPSVYGTSLPVTTIRLVQTA